MSPEFAKIKAREIMNRRMKWVKTKVENTAMKAMKVFAGVVFLMKRIEAWVSNVIVSLLGIAVAAFLFLPKNQNLLGHIESPNAIFLAIGGLIGTVLALVFSLSIIPIQNAAANLTQSVIKLYSRDRLSKYIFSTLSIFCLSSFLMVFGNSMGISKPILLTVDFLFIAFSFDLLRLYHRHVISLLESDKGINKLRDSIKKKISWFQGKISFLAKIRSLFLTKEDKKKLPLNQLESFLYINLSHVVYGFRLLVNELAEIALKAVARSEVSRAQLAIFAMSDVACHYVTVRKNNLRIQGEPGVAGMLGVKGSDIDDLLSPIYEHFKDISRSAVSSRNETTSLHSIRALSQLAIHLTTLESPAYRKHSVPLTHMSIAYMGVCIEAAQRQGLDDVPHQGAGNLLEITKNAPKNVDICDIYLPVLNELNKIALAFLVSNKDTLLNSCIEKIMTVSHHAVYNKHFRAADVIGDITKKLEVLLPIALSYEKIYGSKFLGQPLTPAYDLSNQRSLGYLIARATEMIKKDEKRTHVNPYGNFIDINEKIQGHLYDIGKNNEFGDSFILWHILHTIKHIAKIFIQLVEKPVTHDPAFLEKLTECFSRYCSFFWLAFDEKKTVNYTQAQEACDISGYIGLNFFRLKKQDIVKFCIDNIATIASSYKNISEKEERYNEFNIADLLMPLWHLYLAAEHAGGTETTKLINEKLKEFDVFKNSSKEAEAFENRKRHLQRDFSEGLHWSRNDKSIGILRELLDRKPV